MMIEPQKLEYNDRETNPPAIVACFEEPSKSIDFLVEKVVDTAFTALKSNSTDAFYRKQCWEVIHCYLAASLRLDDDMETLHKFFTHSSFKTGPIPPLQGYPPQTHYKSLDIVARKVQQTALTGKFTDKFD